MPFNLVRDSNLLLVKKSVQNTSTPNVSTTASLAVQNSDKYVPNLTEIKIDGQAVNVTGAQLNYTDTTAGIAQASKAVVLDNNKNTSGLNLLSCMKMFINGSELGNSDGASTSSVNFLTSINKGVAKPNKAIVLDNDRSINNINSLDCSSLETNKYILTSNKVYNERIINSSQTIPNNQWNDICWCPDLKIFIAVGNNCGMISSDGNTWEDITINANNWVDVKWIAKFGLFVICSNTGTNRIMTSINGRDWFNTNTDNTYSYDSIGMDSGYVYVFSSSGSYRTNNGVTWEAIDSKPSNSKNSYNNREKKLLISSTGTSVNTLTISYFIRDINTGDVHSNIDNSTVWANITYGNGNWVMINTLQSYYRMYKSVDGKYWTNIYCNGIDESFIANGIKFINDINTFIVYGYNSTISNVYYSFDCDTWIPIQLPATRCIAWSDYLGQLLFISDTKIYKSKSIYDVNIDIDYSLHLKQQTVDEDNLIVSIKNSHIIKSDTSKQWKQIIYKDKLIIISDDAQDNFFASSSDNGKSITTSISSTFKWNSICYKANLFVIAGDNGFLSSSDTINWNSTTLSYAWSSICYGFGIFVVVSTNGKAAKSSNGVDWELMNMANSVWRSVTATANGFLAVGTNGVIYTLDNINWLSTDCPNGVWRSVCFGNGVIVSVGDGVAMYSKNNIDWFAATCDNCNWQCVIYISKLKMFAACASTGTNRFMYSKDGIKWISLSIESKPWISLCYNSEYDTIILAASSGELLTSSIVVANSKNIFNMSNATVNANGNMFIGSGMYDSMDYKLEVDNLSLYNSSNTKLSLGGENSVNINNLQLNGAAVTTTNFDNMTDIKPGIALENKVLIADENNSISGINSVSCSSLTTNTISNITPGVAKVNSPLIVDTDLNISNIEKLQTNKLTINNKSLYGTKYESSKLYLKNNYHTIPESWITRSLPSTTCNSIYYANSKTIVVANNYIYHSPTGITWSQVPLTGNWKSITYFNGKYVVVGLNSIMYSTDIVNWNSVPSSTGDWKYVTYINDNYVAVGINKIAYSVNGTNWNYTTLTGDWRSICFGDKYVVVGVENVAYANDLTSWTTVAKPSTWNSIVYGIDNYIACSNNYILYSKDGITWQKNKLYSDWKCIIYTLNNYIMLSSNSLAVSINGVDWVYRKINNNQPWSNITFNSDYALLLGISNNILLSSKFLYPTSLNTVKNDIIHTTDKNVGMLKSNPTYKLQLGVDSAAKLSTSTWTVVSDERLKTNIVNADLDECYNNVKNIKLRSYQYNFDDSQTPKLGWIAQEVEQYIAKAVIKSKEHGYDDCRSLDTDQIIANMYGTIKKLINNLEDINNKKQMLYEKYEMLKK